MHSVLCAHDWVSRWVSALVRGLGARQTAALGFGPPPSSQRCSCGLSQLDNAYWCNFLWRWENTPSELHTGTTTPPSTSALQGNQPLLPPTLERPEPPPSLSWQNKWTRVSAYAVAFVKEGGRKEKKKTSACHRWLGSLDYNSAALNRANPKTRADTN